VQLDLPAVPRAGFGIGYDTLRTERPLGIITKLENRITGLARTFSTITNEYAALRAEAERTRADYVDNFWKARHTRPVVARTAELTPEAAPSRKVASGVPGLLLRRLNRPPRCRQHAYAQDGRAQAIADCPRPGMVLGVVEVVSGGDRA
jgi:hypothetical protein